VGDIEKIHRMIEGDQPHAALRHAEQTLAKNPHRASLLDLKATLELALGETDAARATIDDFLKTDPQNASAHACQAMLLASTDGRAAVAPLQKALALIEREMPQRVFEAIGVVGRALLTQGHIVAAQAHLWLHVGLAPKEDPRALELLVSLNHYSGLPLLLRDNLRLVAWPADASWKAEAEKASRIADQGKWLEAATMIDRLGGKHGAEPTLLYNRAVLAGRLADDRALVAGLHAFAQMEVPLDDAVEAEAIAQLLDNEAKEQMLDSVVRIHAIKDNDLLMAALDSDRRIQRFDVDPARYEHSDQPRPRHTYVLLDQPLPETGVGIERGQVPSLSGVISIFGRQTNRPERLELTTDKGPNYERTLAALADAGGDALGEMIDQRVVGSITPTEQALNWRWHFPMDTPIGDRRKLVAEQRHVAITDRWPDVPRPGLAGKAPREAAGDPQLRIPLLAAVLILEQGSNNRGDAASIAVLRDKLGLPQPDSIDASGESKAALPLVRVPRLIMETVSDDDLVQLYRRSILIAARTATTIVAQEVVRRPSVAAKISPADAFRRLIAAEDDDEQALALIQQARQHSEAAGESTATWDLAALELHIESGNPEQAQAMLAQIEQKHLDDPQVAAAVYRLLYETGVISPEELAGHQQHHHHAEPQQPAFSGAAAAVTQESGGRIWTPGSDAPAGGKKSTLWTPS
jgi:tetratricopeptide (TPR) repeat protein